MATDKTLHVFIGFDGREAVAAPVAAHSITRRTTKKLDIKYLKHRELRASGAFVRPWLIEGATGQYIDMIDGRQFSTEFSHTRFLVPALMHYNGWALFMDSDMIFLSDIHKLFALCDDKYAVMCVKHRHEPPLDAKKMDGREQERYFRKNWSSFVLWNCSHPSNSRLTVDHVNLMKGKDLHSFSWLKEEEIGALPWEYNYIHGVSPRLPVRPDAHPDVIHYTDGGPWMDECKDVQFAELWIDEYEHMQRNGEEIITQIPSTAYELREVRWVK